MAQQGTNPKIEELRFRLKTDPKSRLFYQLAEELRKVKAYEDAEQVLRSGLTHNPTYLAAWMSLGRTLREEGKHHDSIEALGKALQIDPGNAVAARLMADEYVALGDKVEAIKKYKLCRALMPADEELDALIDKLEEEINPVTILKPVVAAEPEPLAESTLPGPPTAPAPPPPAPEAEESPFAAESPFAPAEDLKPFADAAAETQREAEVAVATADVQPMREAHDESPFEEPVADYTSATLDVEQPQGMHVESAPLAAEVPAPWPEEEPAAEVFEPSAPAAPAVEDDITNTVTMADLYVQQGHLDRAQSIYESILDRDPNNEAVRAKLDALDTARTEAAPQPNPRDQKVERLEQWLAKVKRGEERRV
jgi:tetratricopeptide (TPR) repeat protein